jgi:2-keto-4-pentenoate hydratase
VTEAAELIWNAWQTGKRLDGLPDDVRPRDERAGMAVQDALVRLAGPVYGWKIGATTEYGQKFLGVDGPLPGPLLSRFRHLEGEIVPADTMGLGVAEPEFAFRMAGDPGPDPSLDDVLDAVDVMLLALEMPDSRYRDHSGVGKAQLIADVACAARFLEGREVPGWREVDLVAQPVTLYSDGEEFSRGTGGMVLGDPRLALHWLARELVGYGHRLRAGDIVTTGTAAPPAPIAPGRHVVGDFGELGTVEVRFAS